MFILVTPHCRRAGSISGESTPGDSSVMTSWVMMTPSFSAAMASSMSSLWMRKKKYSVKDRWQASVPAILWELQKWEKISPWGTWRAATFSDFSFLVGRFPFLHNYSFIGPFNGGMVGYFLYVFWEKICREQISADSRKLSLPSGHPHFGVTSDLCMYLGWNSRTCAEWRTAEVSGLGCPSSGWWDVGLKLHLQVSSPSA